MAEKFCIGCKVDLDSERSGKKEMPTGAIEDAARRRENNPYGYDGASTRI
jgi:hypothetical protein